LELKTEFRVGANLPWIHYGGDFGANAWHPDGGLHTRADELGRALDRVSTAGIRRIRWFMLGDGRTGIRFGPDGVPLGLDEHVFVDVDAALAAAGARDIEIMFVLFDFLWCARPRLVDGVQLGGRRDIWQDRRSRDALLEQVVRPILVRYGRDRRIFAWDIVNEPEWATRGLAARWLRPSVSLDAMQALVRDAAALVHRHTSQAATVGSVSTRFLHAWRELGLDLYQAHWYPKLERGAPLARPVSELELDRPLLLGEFPSRVSPEELQRIVDTARAAGYAEAFVWSILAEDPATDFAAAEAALFRPASVNARVEPAGAGRSSRG
jgi:hypothetical protein